MKKHIAISFSVFVLSILPAVSNAQKVTRQSINVTGSSGKVGSVSIHETTGQTYSTETYYDDKNGVRPGFQQPSNFYVASIEEEQIVLDLYPNPASFELNINYQSTINNVQLRVTNLVGQEIYSQSFGEFHSTKINCSEWSNGTYIVTLLNEQSVLFSSKLIVNK